jgi:hypothetical protein
MRNYWDGYFAGRAAPLGTAPAAVVHAVFYNFADGEVARHIPWVWEITTPTKAEEFSPTHHLPEAQLAAVVDRLRDRGLVDPAGSFTDAGRETRQRIETLTRRRAGVHRPR